MTAAVAVMSATTPKTSTVPKRHGFSIESLIGKSDTSPLPPPPPPLPPLQQISSSLSPSSSLLPSSLSSSSSSLSSSSSSSSSSTSSSSSSSHLKPLSLMAPMVVSASSTTPPPQRPLPIRPTMLSSRDDHHRAERERERHAHREREIREREARDRERELVMLREREARERELVMESLREKELREFRDLRDRELINREREIREFRDNRDGRGSNPSSVHQSHSSPRSSSPPSPRLEKSMSPETENRLSAWAGEEFKHLLGNLHGGPLEANGLYQPLRVCNRALASMNSMGGPPGPLGVGVPHQFPPLPINPLLYNLPRELSPQTHPLLAARYPGFMHPRYPMGPPPGLLFHPYRKPKRNRTAFSPSQLLQLEQAFEKNHYVVGQERKTLAAKLQLTETQVKVWFQNRRTKHKRMKAEEDGGSSGSHPEGQDGDGEGAGSDNMSFVCPDDDEEDACSEDEELSVTEDC